MSVIFQNSKLIAPYPDNPQEFFVICPVTEIFFGGARGGAKTYGLILKWMRHASMYKENAVGLIVRRRYTQLKEVISVCRKLLTPIGGKYNSGNKCWTFPTGPMKGALLHLAHLWNENDAENFQGWGITFLGVEEVTNWPTPDPIFRLYASVRSGSGVTTQICLTGNPGGPGHTWVKNRYIDPAPKGWEIVTDQETGLERVFIPSRLEDNLALMQNDPTYEARLRMLGNNELVKAWRYGLWNINIQSYFADVWNPAQQVIAPFEIPANWQLGRSFDWGHSAPSSLGLWAIADGNFLPNGRWIPKDSLIRVDEKYYALRKPSGEIIPNTGVKMSNKKLGADIARSCGDISLHLSVADPSIFAGAPGESIYDQMTADAPHLWFQAPHTRDRISGWMLMKTLLEESIKDRPEGPGLYVTEDCVDGFIRTVGSVMMDEKNPDDIDTSGEDHAMDEARYFAVTALAGRVDEMKIKWG